jgi:AcrR family transcriptional regulator
MKRHADNARERIIDAAEQIVVEAGARHMTLEAVAAKACVSRGGLLYHFPDKVALLKGMLDRLRTHRAESITKWRAEIPAGPEREAVVYVRSLLDEDSGPNKYVAAAVLASGTHDPELLAPARGDYRQTIANLTKDGLSFERAAIIMLAANGLRFLDVLSMSPFDAVERRKIIGELLAFAKEDTEAQKEV